MKHRTGKIEMRRSRADQRLLYKRGDGKVERMVLLQVNDSLIAGTRTFVNEDKFECKCSMLKHKKH